MPHQSIIAEPVVPTEILDLILQNYLQDNHQSNITSQEAPYSCPPSLVCHLFLSICRPQQYKLVSGLSLGGDRAQNAHFTKVVKLFEDHPHLKQYVQRMEFHVKGSQWDYESFHNDLGKLLFPNVQCLSFTQLERPNLMNWRVLEGLIPNYVAYASPHTLELNDFETLYLPPLLGIRSLRSLRLKGFRSASTNELVPSKPAICRSGITSLEIEGQTQCDPRLGRRYNEFSLNGLLSLEDLKTLSIRNIDALTMESDIFNSVGSLSFNLRKLVIRADGDFIRQLFELYDEQAHMMGVVPFGCLRDVRIEVSSGLIPVDRIVNLLRTTNLERFALCIGEGFDVEGAVIYMIYDAIAEGTNTGRHALVSLEVPFPVASSNGRMPQDIPNNLLPFLNKMASRSVLEELTITFMVDLGQQPVTGLLHQSYLECWQNVVSAVQSVTMFPHLKQRNLHWKCRCMINHEGGQLTYGDDTKYVADQLARSFGQMETGALQLGKRAVSMTGLNLCIEEYCHI